MITYCLGSARQKRAYFSDFPCGLYLDNIEVLYCVSENGSNCFAIGDVPFADFTVREYLRYRRALCASVPSDADIRALGLDPNKRLRKLRPAQMRCVQFLEKTGGIGKISGKYASLIVNLDGCRARGNRAALKRLVRLFDNVYVCVTDEKFVRKHSPCRLLRFGRHVAHRRGEYKPSREFACAVPGVKRVVRVR